MSNKNNFIVLANGKVIGFTDYDKEVNSYGTLIVYTPLGKEKARFTMPYSTIELGDHDIDRAAVDFDIREDLN